MGRVLEVCGDSGPGTPLLQLTLPPRAQLAGQLVLERLAGRGVRELAELRGDFARGGKELAMEECGSITQKSHLVVGRWSPPALPDSDGARDMVEGPSGRLSDVEDSS